jgi:hypothetical protein
MTFQNRFSVTMHSNTPLTPEQFAKLGGWIKQAIIDQSKLKRVGREHLPTVQEQNAAAAKNQLFFNFEVTEVAPLSL